MITASVMKELNQFEWNFSDKNHKFSQTEIFFSNRNKHGYEQNFIHLWGRRRYVQKLEFRAISTLRKIPKFHLISSGVNCALLQNLYAKKLDEILLFYAVKTLRMLKHFMKIVAKPAIACSKSTIETLEQSVKYVQS